MKKLLTSLILAAAGLFATNSYADHRPTDDYFRLTSVAEFPINEFPTVGIFVSENGYIANTKRPERINNKNHSIFRELRGLGYSGNRDYYHLPHTLYPHRKGNYIPSSVMKRTFLTITVDATFTTNTTTATTATITTGTVTSTNANTITTTTETPTTKAVRIMELERIDRSQTLRAELDTIAELEKISHRADIDLFDFGIGCFESRIGCTPDHYREALRGRDRVIFGTALEHLEECIVDALGGGIIHATKQEVLNLALYVRGGIMYHRRQNVNGEMMIILKYRQSNFHRNTYEKVCDYLQTRDWNGRIPAGIRGADIVQNAHRTYERH